MSTSVVHNDTISIVISYIKFSHTISIWYPNATKIYIRKKCFKYNNFCILRAMIKVI